MGNRQKGKPIFNEIGRFKKIYFCGSSELAQQSIRFNGREKERVVHRVHKKPCVFMQLYSKCVKMCEIGFRRHDLGIKKERLKAAQ